jgi:hypothetical protein
VRIENGSVELDPIPASTSLDDDSVRCEDSAKPRDVRLQAVCCGRRWIVAPDFVDQAPVRDDLPCTQEQCRQHRPLLAAAQLDGALVDFCIERTEDPESEWF